MTLHERMKQYEAVSQTHLMRRTPVIIRLDGVAFHTFTKDFDKPFDVVFGAAMQTTTRYLVNNIQGCVLGYTQSDEITLVLVDYKSLDSEAWFDYGIQKICSVAASKATKHFNRIFAEKTAGIINRYYNDFLPNKEKYNYLIDDVKKLVGSYERALKQGAEFDARAFNIPISEVTNCVLWRQQDATRNSISGLAQAHFSHKELHGKNTNQMQDMLMNEYGINWNNIDTCEKRGTCVIKADDGWKIDTEIPIFTGDGRKYIEDLIAES